LGEILPNLPPGVATDTSTFSDWVDGLPVGFTKTFQTSSSYLDDPTNIHTLSGTVGKQLNDNSTLIATILKKVKKLF
jgi:hypothetical protein